MQNFTVTELTCKLSLVLGTWNQTHKPTSKGEEDHVGSQLPSKRVGPISPPGVWTVTRVQTALQSGCPGWLRSLGWIQSRHSSLPLSSLQGLVSRHTSSRTRTGQNRPGQIPVPQTVPAGPTREEPSGRWHWSGKTGPGVLAEEWLYSVVAVMCWSQAEPLPRTHKQTKVRIKGNGAQRIKTNLERQLSLLWKGFWLIDFYFLALLSKTIISKELPCPARTESKLICT